jgi:hypothetical protein
MERRSPDRKIVAVNIGKIRNIGKMRIPTVPKGARKDKLQKKTLSLSGE